MKKRLDAHLDFVPKPIGERTFSCGYRDWAIEMQGRHVGDVRTGGPAYSSVRVEATLLRSAMKGRLRYVAQMLG